MAKIDEATEPVVFLDAEGNEISNSPVWLARQTLKNAGVAFEGSQPAQLQAALAADAAPAAVAHSDDDDDLDDVTEDLDEAGNRTYKELVRGELASYAKSRGVEVSGKKAGAVRDELIAQDTDARAKADVEAANAKTAKK
jgi:hypothetical protein